MLTRKAKAIIAAWVSSIILTAAGALVAGVKGLTTAETTVSRVGDVERQVIETSVQVGEVDRRLDRIEAKLDRLIERK